MAWSSEYNGIASLSLLCFLTPDPAFPVRQGKRTIQLSPEASHAALRVFAFAAVSSQPAAGSDPRDGEAVCLPDSFGLALL
jgi:hypothetical protein